VNLWCIALDGLSQVQQFFKKISDPEESKIKV